MAGKTPEKLFVCIFRVKAYYYKNVDRLNAKGIPLPPKLKAIRERRVQFTGELMEKGVLWMGGPAVDAPLSMNIFAVDSIEEAIKLQRNDPCFAEGLFYNDKYFEWELHVAFTKVSARLRERHKKLMASRKRITHR